MTRTHEHDAYALNRSPALWRGVCVRGMGLGVIAIGGDPARRSLSRKGLARTI